MLQHLHSMHCQRYVFTAAIMTGVNCRQEGCPVVGSRRETQGSKGGPKIQGSRGSWPHRRGIWRREGRADLGGIQGS